MRTVIVNVRIFDGHEVAQATSLAIEDGLIAAIGVDQISGDDVVDGTGATLLPGLIDCHTHTAPEYLAAALQFGVTTELEMMGHWTPEHRGFISDNDSMADVRSAGPGMTAPGGHPGQLFKDHDDYDHPDVPDPKSVLPPGEVPGVATPEEAVAFVRERVAEGADYIKIMIEEGTVLAHPRLPMLDQRTIVAAVEEAHAHGKLVIAHALTVETAERAVEAGVDGLAHLWIDPPRSDALVNKIAERGVFVCPCLTLNSSIFGRSGRPLAEDDRVAPKLSRAWCHTLCSCFNTWPQGRMEDQLASVRALHAAGVEVLAGTDASVPLPKLGGLAHGASLHHELQLLVDAGFTPIEALRAATSKPARLFGLADRGRLAAGLRADLVLVDGDPTTNIGDTLSVQAVWRRGTRLKERP